MKRFNYLVFCAFLLPARITNGSFIQTFIEKGVTETFKGTVLFEREAKSATHCALMCVNTPPCESVTMIASTSGSSLTCQGQAVWFSTSPTLDINGTFWTKGWSVRGTSWLGKSCLDDNECTEDNTECFDGSCVCSPGYYYSHSNNSCVEECLPQNLQPQFLPYRRRRIAYNNLDRFPNISLSECLTKCTQSSGIRSCDYRYYDDQRFYCCPQAVTKLDVTGDEWVTSHTNIHYQRTCL